MNPFEGSAKNSTGGGEFEVPEPGSVAGVLVAIVDLGTHNEAFQGAAPKKVRKAFFVWELVDSPMGGTKNNFCIGKEYSLSYHKKSGLRIAFEKWRGKAYAEGEQINYASALGKPCLVSVSHKEAKESGNTYAVMSGISKLPKGMAASSPKYKPFLFLVQPGCELPTQDWLPSVFCNGELMTASQKIQRSDEWRQMGSPPAPSSNGNGKQNQDADEFDAAAETEEAVPF